MIRFLSQAVRNYKSTGAIAPSSRFLARAMVRSMPMTKNQRILEVGAGTGAFTKEILGHLRDGDALHIVELNPAFCEHLQLKVLDAFQKSNPAIEVTLHRIPIEDVEIAEKFDNIICGLPFNNFPLDLVQHHFEVMFNLLKEGSELAYFEYLGMRTLKRLFGTTKVRLEAKERIRDYKERMAARHGSTCTVFRNLPSCRVVRLKG